MPIFQRVVRFVCALLFVVAPAAAQDGSGVITGTVHSALSGGALPGVQVVAFVGGDTTTIRARGLSDSSGRFTLAGLRPGSYTVDFRLLGYGRVARQVTLTGSPVDVGIVTLAAEAITMQEITVTAEPPAVEYAPDRDIYSVDAMAAAAGGTASDAMGQIPELEVDINGQVTLRGNAPTIYINGRPAPMTGESLAVFLQQFPAENIQSIEVMPNPSARYRAEGNGGIVNIVLKRGVRLGMTGSVFANAGSRGELGTGARATWMADELTIQGGTSARLNRTETSTAETRLNLLADPITLLGQESISDRSGNSGNLDLEVQYRPGERTEFSVQGRINGNLAGTDRTTNYTEMLVDSTVTDRYARIAADDSRGLSTDFAFEAQHEIGGDDGHEVEVQIQHQRGRSIQESLVRQRLLEDLVDEDPTIELTLDDQNEHEDETGIRVDYARPLVGRTQIEMGYEAEIGQSTDGQIRQVGPEDSVLVSTDRGFTQRQAVQSGYLTLQGRFNKFNAQVGVRGEYTDDRYRLNDGGVEFGGSYRSFFPNANVSYEIARGSRVRASYSMRVRRPSANILNPTDRSTDPLNRRVGNPDIDPTYTHSFTFDASWRKGPVTLRVAPFYQRSVDEFTSYKTVDENGVSTTTWANLSSSSSYGTTVSLSLRNWRRLGGSINLNGRREDRDGSWVSEQLRQGSTRWSVRTNLDARVTETLSVQGNINYQPRREMAQGVAAATVMSAVAIRQRLMDGRASVNLSITDPFDAYRPRTEMFDPAFREYGRDRVSIRRVSVSMSYSFGGRGRAPGR